VPSFILRRPNKLAFPGTRPGIDLTHSASQNLRLSAICSGTSAAPVNLASAMPPLVNIGGTLPTRAIDPLIGPTILGASGSAQFGVTGLSWLAPNTTIAGIFNYTVSGGAAYQTLLAFDGAANGLWIQNNQLIFFGSGVTYNSGFTFSQGSTYFYIVSTASVGANSPHYFLVKDLNTGRVLTSAGTATDSAITHNSFRINNDSGNEYSNCRVAATMYSLVCLGLPRMLLWAEDPWSFWYPQKIDIADMLHTAPTVAVRGATLPMMGVG
jgi:hypothetical protein